MPCANPATWQPDKSKPTILILSEDATIHSGLGRVTKSIFNDVYATGKWNIMQLAWGGPGTESVPWPIFRTEKDPATGLSTEADKRGDKTLVELVKRFKPDIVWAFADPWTIQHAGYNFYRGSYYLIAYTCIDSEPIHPQFRSIYDQSDLVVTFGKWPRDVLKSSFGIDSEVIPHGVDLGTFYPDKQAGAMMRAEMGVTNPEAILLGTVARNQPRKNLGAMFPMLHHLRTGRYSICSACGRVTLDEINPGNLEIRKKAEQCRWCRSKEVTPGIEDDRWMWYYHGAIQDVEPWHIIMLANRYQLQKAILMNGAKQSIVGNTDRDLNAIYNAFDIFTMPTVCEGFGLPIAEAMSAQIPVVLPAYSAYMDWAPQGGLMVDYEPFIEFRSHHTRAQVCIEDWIRCLLQLKDPIEREDLGRSGRECMLQYSWADINKLWIKLFSNLPSKKAIPEWSRSYSL